jgi:hypothetical protein
MVSLEFSHWRNRSCRTMELGLTQPLTGMSTRNISLEVKAAGAKGWQTYHLHVPIVLKSGSLNLLETYGPVQAYNGIALPLEECWSIQRIGVNIVHNLWFLCSGSYVLRVMKFWLETINWYVDSPIPCGGTASGFMLEGLTRNGRWCM